MALDSIDNRMLKKRLLNIAAKIPVDTLFNYFNKSSTAILMYHRITNQDSFEQHIRYITQYYKVLDLDTLVSYLTQEKTLPQRSLAITFDDGYQCLYDHAYPVLKRYKCPATIFLNTGTIENRQPIWPVWVREYIFNANVSKINLEISKRNLLIDVRDTQRRFLAYRKVVEFFKREWQAHLWQNLEILWEACGKPIIIWNKNDLPLTWNQVERMEEGELIRFGNHTHTHRILPHVDDSTMLSEINDAEKAIQANVESPSRIFAYPNGTYDPRAEICLQGLGYIGGLSIKQQFLSIKSNPMFLERIGANDSDSLALLKLRLSGALSLVRRIYN